MNRFCAFAFGAFGWEGIDFVTREGPSPTFVGIISATSPVDAGRRAGGSRGGSSGEDKRLLRGRAVEAPRIDGSASLGVAPAGREILVPLI